MPHQKLNLSLCLIKQQAMKAGRHTGIDPCSFSHGTTWMWLVIFMSQLLYSRERAPCCCGIEGWVIHRASLNAVTKRSAFYLSREWNPNSWVIWLYPDLCTGKSEVLIFTSGITSSLQYTYSAGTTTSWTFAEKGWMAFMSSYYVDRVMKGFLCKL